jgi:phospholipid transport system substrate-binding protein
MKVKLISISLVLLLVTTTMLFAANSPISVIKQTNKDLTKKTDGKKADIEIIVDVLEQSTDFESIATSVLAKHCKKISKDECKRINEVFVELLKYSTAKKLRNSNENTTEYLSEKISKKSATVHTIVKSGKRKVKIDYQMESKDGSWKIINYIVDDIDTIKNYKKQFKRLFKKSSVDEIIAKLEKKIKKYKN